MKLDEFPSNETFPACEWLSVFTAETIDWRDAGAPSSVSERRIGLDDIAEVVDWDGHTNEPGGGTELTLVAILRLNDGTFAAVDAWNDYTGWGCRDGVEVLFASTLDDLKAWLTDETRRRLGIAPTSTEERNDDQ